MKNDILNKLEISIAQYFVAAKNPVFEKMEFAQELAVEDEQDFENETTIFTFEDGSKLKFHNSDNPTLV